MNSLRARLLFSAAGVLLAFVLLTALALDAADRQRAEQAVQDRLQGLIYALIGALDIDDEGAIRIDDADLPDARLRQPDSGLTAVIAAPGGELVWHSLSTMDLKLDVPASDVGQWRFLPAQGPDDHFMLVFGFSWLVGENEALFRLALSEDARAFVQQRRAFQRSLWLSLLLAAVLLLALLLAILNWGLLPIGRLAEEVHEVEAGEREAIGEKQPDELRPLAIALNALLRNERKRQQRYRDALADLAHSLKTPLAALRGQQGKTLNDVEPLDRMQQLIDYQLQKAVAGAGRSFAAPVRVRPLASRLVTALSKVHAERGIVFDNRLPADFQLRMEEAELLEVLGNLLDNATRFAASRVLLSASSEDSAWLLKVEDDGPGFPGDAQSLLQRGVRADSRNPGQGIGLAVVAEIVQANGGDIQLGQSELGGACVAVSLAVH